MKTVCFLKKRLLTVAFAAKQKANVLHEVHGLGFSFLSQLLIKVLFGSEFT
jgi:hypothetical protein